MPCMRKGIFFIIVHRPVSKEKHAESGIAKDAKSHLQEEHFSSLQALLQQPKWQWTDSRNSKKMWKPQSKQKKRRRKRNKRRNDVITYLNHNYLYYISFNSHAKGQIKEEEKGCGSGNGRWRNTQSLACHQAIRSGLKNQCSRLASSPKKLW